MQLCRFDSFCLDFNFFFFLTNLKMAKVKRSLLSLFYTVVAVLLLTGGRELPLARRVATC